MKQKPTYNELKKTVKELKNNEIKWQNLFNAQDDLMLIINKDFNIEKINEKGLKLLKKKYKEVIGKKYYEVIYNKKGSHNNCPFNKSIKSKKVESSEIFLTNYKKHFFIKSTPIFDNDSKILGVVMLFSDITEKYKTEKSLKKNAHDLQERIKELNCLYAISKFMDLPNISLEKLLNKVVAIIPPSWQYPEITCARIILNNKPYTTNKFKDTIWKQTSPIRLNGKKVGDLEVFYMEEKSIIDGGPFLREERNLINVIAERLGGIIEQKYIEAELRNSEEIRRNFMDFSPDSFTLLDSELNYIELNKTELKILSKNKKEEIIGKNILEINPIYIKPDIYYKYREVIKTGVPLLTDNHLLHPKFGNLYLRTRAFKVGDYLGIIGEDVTKQKQAEEKIKLFSDAINGAIDGIIIADLKGIITYVNPGIRKLFGYNKGEFIGKHISIISQDYKVVKKKISDLIKMGSWIGEIMCKKKNKKEIFHVLLSLSMIKDIKKKPIAIMANIRDITEKKQTERKILNAIIETEEKERERFAKDLHDDLGTLLSSINLYIKLLISKETKEDEKQDILNLTKGLIDGAISNTKEIANNLRPNIISRFGLIPAIKSYCDKINETGLIKIILNAIINKNLNKDLEVAIYRIIKELINNTLKHASATKIEINISNYRKILKLIYIDNGIGFDIEKIINKKLTKGMGLSNIMSRIKAINGTYKIFSSKEKGTKLVIEVGI